MSKARPAGSVCPALQNVIPAVRQGHSRAQERNDALRALIAPHNHAAHGHTGQLSHMLCGSDMPAKAARGAQEWDDAVILARVRAHTATTGLETRVTTRQQGPSHAGTGSSPSDPMPPCACRGTPGRRSGTTR